jgi:hypothetical protein
MGRPLIVAAKGMAVEKDFAKSGKYSLTTPNSLI